MDIFQDDFFFREKERADVLLQKVKDGVSGDEARVISFDALYALLLDEEIAIIEGIVAIDPRTYGFKGLYFGMTDVPDDLVALVGQEYGIGGGTKVLQTQYLPARVHAAYLRLNDAMYERIGRRVLVESGYRSPAYQAIVFLRYLAEHDGDVRTAAARIAVPGYSEHGNPAMQGMDVRTRETVFDEDGIAIPFGNTVEYRWLADTAKDFGFAESYPEGNPWGVIPEPWHWRWEGYEGR